MAYYRDGFTYNMGNIFGEEFFDYGRGPPPNHLLMNEPEIIEQQPHEDHRHNFHRTSHQQMYQLYHDDHNYGTVGYHSPRRNYNYPYAPQEIPFSIPRFEYPPDQVSVRIRLSDRRYIGSRLIHEIEGLGHSVKVRGDVITVSGYPGHDREREFLFMVQRISGDRGARIDW